MSVPDFATPEDIRAARPDLSLETIRRCCRTGVIPGARLVGRSWAIPERSALDFVATFERYGRKTEAAPGSPLPGAAPHPQEEAC